jgi:hypothetical protein
MEFLTFNEQGQWDLKKSDDLDAKIKAKMKEEMDRRGMTGAKIQDHYDAIDESVPAKQRSNIKSNLDAQEKRKSFKVVKDEGDMLECSEDEKVKVEEAKPKASRPARADQSKATPFNYHDSDGDEYDILKPKEEAKSKKEQK